MLCSAQTDTFCTEHDSHVGILRCIGIGSDTHCLDLIDIAHELLVVLEQVGILLIHCSLENLNDLGRLDLDLCIVDSTVEAVDGDVVTFLDDNTVDLECLGGQIDMDLTCTGDTRATHTSSDNSSVAGHTAAACDNTLGNCHTADILRRSLCSDKNYLPAELMPCLCILSRENNLSACSSGRCIESVRKRLDSVSLDLSLVENRSKELVELACGNSGNSGLLVDEAFLDHFDLGPEPAEDRSLSVSGLQHVELSFLDCELHILHVVIMLLESLSDLAELIVDIGVDLAECFDGLRCSDTGNNVLALSVHEILAVEVVVSCGGVTCECNTCTGCLTHVTEDHALDVDCCSEKSADVIHLSVLDGSGVVP